MIEFAFWQILAIVAHEGCHILLKSKPFVYDNPIIVRAYQEELGMARTINECIVRAIERKVIEIYEPEYVSYWENSVEKEGLKELINVIQRIHGTMRRRGLTINETMIECLQNEEVMKAYKQYKHKKATKS